MGLLAAGLMAVVALAFGAGTAGAATTVDCPPFGSDDLQSAIDTAPPGGTIVVNGDCKGHFVIDGSNGTNSGHITLVGGSSSAALDGNFVDVPLDIIGGATPTISNLRIVNGRDDDGGGIGIVDCNTTVNLVAVSVLGNVTTDGDGGGILVDCATLTVTNSLIRGNHADADGGGLAAVEDAVVTLTGTTVRGNSADSGGGIHVGNAILSATASTIVNNEAGHGGFGHGGGINAFDSNILLTSTKVTTNRVTSDNEGFYNRGGGGIRVEGDYVPDNGSPINGGATGGAASGRAVTLVPDGLTLVNSSVDHNVSLHGNGGGIWNIGRNTHDSTVTLDRSTVSFNTAPEGSGGGIANIGVCPYVASVLATGSTFQGNQAHGDGGAVFNIATGDDEECDPGTALVTIGQSPVANGPNVVNSNTAHVGGGFANEQAFGGVASLTLQPGATVRGNKATAGGGGGGVFNNCGSFSSLAQIFLNSPNNVTNLCM